MAKNDELLARLNNKEDNFTERKLESAGNYEFRKTIVAFANSVPENHTGILFIGVRNDGTVAGVNGADSLQKTIRNICETDCYPPIKHTCAVLVVESKDVVAAEISHSNQRPHFAGPAFVRVGSESKIATPELYQDLLTSHCSHAGQLLKLKNQIVTVMTIRKVLGKPTPVPNDLFNRTHECKVTDVTPSIISLRDIGSDINYAEPIENVQISHDEEKHRPMLIVRPT